MNRQICAAGLVLLLLACAGTATAAVPLSINYSGELVETTSGSEQEIVDRNTVLYVRLYKSPTDTQALWARQYAVILNKGKFTLEISETGGSEIGGASTPSLQAALNMQAADSASDALYIGVRPMEDLPDLEITPRQRVVSVPFAMLANDVTRARRNFTVTNGLVTVKNLTVLQNAVFSNRVTIAASQGTSTVQFVSSPLFVEGISNQQANSSMSLARNATLTGPATFKNGLVVTSLTSTVGVAISGGLTVGGPSVLDGGLTANGSLAVGSGGSTLAGSCLVPSSTLAVAGAATVTNLSVMNASFPAAGASMLSSLSSSMASYAVDGTESGSWQAPVDCFVIARVTLPKEYRTVRGRISSCKFYASPTATPGTGTFLAEVGMGTSSATRTETGYYGTRHTSLVLKSGEYLTWTSVNARHNLGLLWRTFNYSY